MSFSSMGSEARLSDIQEMYIDKGPSLDKCYDTSLVRDKKPLPLTVNRRVGRYIVEMKLIHRDS